jgi:hypothetical protein
MITPVKYQRKPEPVDAIQLTTTNAEEVAAWCGGQVNENTKASDPTDVSVTVVFPTLTGPVNLEVGMFLIKNEKGAFSRALENGFNQVYEAVVEEAPENI